MDVDRSGDRGYHRLRIGPHFVSRSACRASPRQPGRERTVVASEGVSRASRVALLVLAVFAVVQTLEGLVISPKIMGDRVGLHPLTIIIAVMVGTTLLGGLLGGILAIPLTAALRVVMFRYVWRKHES